MRPTAERQNASISLGNILFWQAAGLLIGGLTPTSVLFFCPDDGFLDWFWLAAAVAPLTAILGGALGTVIGICDRRPNRRCPRQEETPPTSVAP